MARAWEYALIAGLITVGLISAGGLFGDSETASAESDNVAQTLPSSADEYYDEGYELYYGDTDAEEEKGVTYLKKAHELGHLEAADKLGDYYNYVNKDPDKAVKWYREGVIRGDGDAMAALGHLYEGGKYLEEDKAKAFELFQKAANMENDGGLYNTGRFYKNGYIVDQDVSQAISYYERAHIAGYQKAGNAIARLYEIGDGVPADPQKAYDWYLLGSEAGWAWSFSKLGDVHSQGLLGQPVDNAKAYGWYLMARDEGWSSAVEMGEAGIAKLAPLLTDEEKKDAEQKAKDCDQYVLKHCELQ